MRAGGCMFEWQVSERDSGITVLRFLKNQVQEKLSTRALKSAIDAGRCRVNRRAERFSSALVGFGDRVSLSIENKPAASSRDFLENPKRIVFMDEWLLA